MQLDEKDFAIIELLKKDAQLTTSKISKATRIPITTVHNRIKKLAQTGIIKNFTISLDQEKIGKSISAYILLTVNQNLVSGKKISQQSIAAKIKEMGEIESVDITTGATDMILKVRCSNIRALNSLITSKLRQISGVDKTQTMMVLEEI